MNVFSKRMGNNLSKRVSISADDMNKMIKNLPDDILLTVQIDDDTDEEQAVKDQILSFLLLQMNGGNNSEKE